MENSLNQITGLLLNLDVNAVKAIFMTTLGENLMNIAIYSLGMAVYVIVIWYYYRILSKRDLFDVNIPKPDSIVGFFNALWNFIMFLFRYFVIFPIISFIWFLILAIFLLVLSKSQDVTHIFLMSMTIIATSRISAYFNEELAKDVAKLIPLALLGVFIVDPTYFSIDKTIEKFLEASSLLPVILQYLVFVAGLEFTLRVLHKLKNALNI